MEGLLSHVLSVARYTAIFFSRLVAQQPLNDPLNLYYRNSLAAVTG